MLTYKFTIKENLSDIVLESILFWGRKFEKQYPEDNITLLISDDKDYLGRISVFNSKGTVIDLLFIRETPDHHYIIR